MNKYLKFSKLILASLAFMLFFSFQLINPAPGFVPRALAEKETKEETEVTVRIDPLFGNESLEDTADIIIEVLQNFVGGIAIIMIIIAGMLYIFSGGNEQRLELGKKMFVAAVIGLGVILAARTILGEVFIIFEEEAPENIVTGSQRAYEIAGNVLSLLLSILAIIGTIALVYSGILYLTSGGNDEIMEKAKKQFIYAIIGLSISIGGIVIINQLEEIILQ